MSVEKLEQFAPEKFELEIGEVVYQLELDNESVKRADEIGIIEKAGNMGVAEMLQHLIYVFGIKNHSMTPSRAKKIAANIIDEKEYDPTEVATMLIEELALRYQQVFTIGGAKKTLKKM